MSDFTGKFLNPDPIWEAAYFLALRYAVWTEEHDRTLPHHIEQDCAMVVASSRGDSLRYARSERVALHRLSAAAGVTPEVEQHARERVAKLSFADQKEQLQRMPAALCELCDSLAACPPSS